MLARADIGFMMSEDAGRVAEVEVHTIPTPDQALMARNVPGAHDAWEIPAVPPTRAMRATAQELGRTRTGFSLGRS